MTDKDIKKESSSRDTWIRAGFILIFAIIYGISKIVIWSVVIFQLFSLLITRQTNSQLRSFSQSLSVFVYQLLQYVMFNSDEKPFPFSEWPNQEPVSIEQKTASKKKTAKKAATKKTTGKKKVIAKKKE